MRGKNRKRGFSKKGDSRLVLFHGIYRDIDMLEKLELPRYGDILDILNII